MNAAEALHLVRQALLLTIVLSAAPVLAALVVGLIVSLFQAATQLNEQTLSFAPKIIAIYATLAALGSTLLALLVGRAAAWIDLIRDIGG